MKGGSGKNISLLLMSTEVLKNKMGVMKSDVCCEFYKVYSDGDLCPLL